MSADLGASWSVSVLQAAAGSRIHGLPSFEEDVRRAVTMLIRLTGSFI
jgi:hypothetical protein